MTNAEQGMMLDPSVLAAFGNTLGPAGILRQLLAQQQEQQAKSQAGADAANAAANSAGQEYSQAAAAPMPEVSARDQFIPSLFGHIAAGIAQDKSYVDRAHAHIAGQKQALREHRIQNLQVLKDNYDRKAAHAESVGNHADSEAARLKSESMAKTLQLMLHEDTQSHLESRNAANIQSREKIAGEKAKTSSASGVDMDGPEGSVPSFDNEIITTAAGNKFMDSTNFKGVKDYNAARERAAKLGMPFVPPAAAKDLRTAQEVYQGLDQVDSVLEKMLPQQTGNPMQDLLSRQRAGLKNFGQALTQSGSDAAAFQSTLPLAIRGLQAVAAGPGSGFRLNQNEINMITKRWPRLNDNIETARAKLAWERWFLRNKENAILKRDWTKADLEPEPATEGLPATGFEMRTAPGKASAKGGGDPKDPAGIL